MYVIVKIVVSAIVIGIVTKVARRFPAYGGDYCYFSFSDVIERYLAVCARGKDSDIDEVCVRCCLGDSSYSCDACHHLYRAKAFVSLICCYWFRISWMGLCLLIQEIVLRNFK